MQKKLKLDGEKAEKALIAATKKEQQNQQEDELSLIRDLKGEEFLFVVNHQKFIHEIRTKEIWKCVRGKISVEAGKVIFAILNETNKIQKSSEVKQTENLNLEQVQAIYQRCFPNQNMTQNQIRDCLQQCKNDGLQLIEEIYRDSQIFYCVNLDNVIQKLKLRHAMKIVERRYNVDSARIMRVLSEYEVIDELTVP